MTERERDVIHFVFHAIALMGLTLAQTELVRAFACFVGFLAYIGVHLLVLHDRSREDPSDA